MNEGHQSPRDDDFEGEGEEEVGALYLQDEDASGDANGVVFLAHLQLQLYAEGGVSVYSEAAFLALALVLAGQHVDVHSVVVGFVGVASDDFDFEGEVDIGAVFEGYFHGAFARDLDHLDS